MSNTVWKFKEVVTKAATDEALRFKLDNEDALPYKAITFVRIVRNAPSNYFKQPVIMVGDFLDNKAYVAQTNVQLTQIVANRVTPYPVPANFMDKPLSAKQLNEIGTLMAQHGLAFDRNAQNSLSKIKLAIQAGKSAADAELVFKGTLTIGPRFVTVGTKRLAVCHDDKGYRRIKVGSQKLRVDVLQALLEAGNLPSSTE